MLLEFVTCEYRLDVICSDNVGTPFLNKGMSAIGWLVVLGLTAHPHLPQAQ